MLSSLLLDNGQDLSSGYGTELHKYETHSEISDELAKRTKKERETTSSQTSRGLKSGEASGTP
jgi:hypothetical protein